MHGNDTVDLVVPSYLGVFTLSMNLFEMKANVQQRNTQDRGGHNRTWRGGAGESDGRKGRGGDEQSLL